MGVLDERSRGGEGRVEMRGRTRELREVAVDSVISLEESFASREVVKIVSRVFLGIKLEMFGTKRLVRLEAVSVLPIALLLD